MVHYQSVVRLDLVFAALADPTRRGILTRLARGESAVSELAEPFRMSLPAVAKHVRVLERAGLLTSRREGRERRCRLSAAPMRDAAAWMEPYRRFWEHQLDRLAKYLGEPPAQEEPWQARSGRGRRSSSRSRGRSGLRGRKSSRRGRPPRS